VELLDAIVEKLSPRAALARAVTGRYDAVLALTSQLSWSEDETFFRELKERTGACCLSRVIYRGFRRGVAARRPFLDGALLDLTAPDLCTYLRRERGRPKPRLPVRVRAIIEGRWAGPPFSYPHPRFDLFWKQPIASRCRCRNR
jgi:hypothetical protein